MQRNIFGLIDLPESMISHLRQQKLVLDLQGAGPRLAALQPDAYPVGELEAVYLASIGNEMHPDIEWRKHFILLHPDMLIQFYVAFNIFDATAISSSGIAGKIYEWQVLIQRLMQVPFNTKGTPLELQQAKQLLADVIYRIKGIPGSKTADITEVRVTFRDDEWQAYHAKPATAFVYEVLSPEDRQCYAEQLQGWQAGWYIDKGRDISIWLQPVSNWQESAVGMMDKVACLRIGRQVFRFVMRKGSSSVAFSDRPFVIIWDKIISYSPENLHGFEWTELLAILKEALFAWGNGYESNAPWHFECMVKFNF